MTSLYAIVIICNGILCERKMTTQVPSYVTIETCAEDAKRDMRLWVLQNKPGWEVVNGWCGVTRGDRT